MSIKFEEVQNLKIVPENYKSATVFDVLSSDDEKIKILLPKIKENELDDYNAGSEVSAFGLTRDGLLYFETKVLERCGEDVTLEYPKVLHPIQRRKYTRVPFNGTLSFPQNPEIKIKTDDLSAGGLKFSSDTPFDSGEEYKIKIELVNNLIVECNILVIRVLEETHNPDFKYSISAKFTQIRSIDRIALMQYSLRVQTEMENKK